MTKKIRLVLSKNVSIPSDQNMTQVAKYVPKEEYFSTLHLYTTNVYVKHVTIEKKFKTNASRVSKKLLWNEEKW